MDQPTQNERMLAGSVHIASIFFPWLAPIIGLIVAGKSKYLRYHSLLALTQQVVLTLVIALIVTISLSHSIYTLYREYQNGFKDFNIWPILIKSIVVWIGFALFGLWNTIASIVDAFRALGGKWGGRGFSSRISRRMLHVQNAQGS